jgi:hypothetical protein
MEDKFSSIIALSYLDKHEVKPIIV